MSAPVSRSPSAVGSLRAPALFIGLYVVPVDQGSRVVGLLSVLKSDFEFVGGLLGDVGRSVCVRFLRRVTDPFVGVVGLVKEQRGVQCD